MSEKSCLNKKITYLSCISCDARISLRDAEYVCPGCGGNLDFRYDYKAASRVLTRRYLRESSGIGIGRYLPLLPVSDSASLPPLHVGDTPLFRVTKVEKEYRSGPFYLKDETRNPSLSFKDRASAVFLASAVEKKNTRIIAASTGNAGSSLACLAASMGIRPTVLVPENAPLGKILQLLMFGVRLFAVRGSYDDAFNLAQKVSQKFGYYSRNTGYNPYTREGKKTVSYEICEQLGFTVPDYVFVSVGDGNIISGVYKGFYDFKMAGLTGRIPRIIAVQSSRSNAVYRAWESYRRTGRMAVRPVKATTVADSISVDLPSDGLAALKAVVESSGFALQVTDAEILEHVRLLPRLSGVFAEPAAACAFAGFTKAQRLGLLKRSAVSVCLITGNGLKDMKTALTLVAQPKVIDKEDLSVF